MKKLKLYLRRILAFLIIDSFHGRCGHCNLPWNEVATHTTYEIKEDGSFGGGCFPLCEFCWKLLSYEERKPHYQALFNLWMKDPDPGREEYIKRLWEGLYYESRQGI